MVVVDRSDDHLCPELRPVLAYAPLFIFESAIADSNCKRVFRLSPSNIRLRVEMRKMPANDLVGTISFDTLRALVPGGYKTPGIEHHDRIILDALQQESEPLFAGCG